MYSHDWAKDCFIYLGLAHGKFLSLLFICTSNIYWECPESMTDRDLEFYNEISTVFWMEAMFHRVPESLSIQIADTLLTLDGIYSGTGASDRFTKHIELNPPATNIPSLQLSYMPCKQHTTSCASYFTYCRPYDPPPTRVFAFCTAFHSNFQCGPQSTQDSNPEQQ